MGALTAYVHVRLCCSLCHHGRDAHRSLPRRNRRIYGCTLPAGKKMGCGGGVSGGRRRERGRNRGKQKWGRPQRDRKSEIKQRRGSEMRTQKGGEEMKQSKEKSFLSGNRKMERWSEEREGEGQQRRQTGRRSFQPSTHQRLWLFRCLVGGKGRQTDCSQ